MTNRDKIIKLFKAKKELSVKEIVDEFTVSKQMVHIVLNQLVSEKFIVKQGRAPKTIYKLMSLTAPTNVSTYILIDSTREFLQKTFLLITEVGEILTGAEAFAKWCVQRKLPIEKTANEYIETQKKYEAYKNKTGIINGIEKLKNTKGYDKINLDELVYCDFYAIERFGKTRLGTLLHYAKQGQNKLLMKILVNEISTTIKKYLSEVKADAIGFVPPTIRRELQIMKFIEKQLKIDLPIIKINKTSGIIPVPQKSLNKLEERINNAENTFSVTGNNFYKHVVLIDDAVGSGSTLNQIAGKLKTKQLAKKVTGLAIVGSFKGFDVITDV